MEFQFQKQEIEGKMLVCGGRGVSRETDVRFSLLHKYELSVRYLSGELNQLIGVISFELREEVRLEIEI